MSRKALLPVLLLLLVAFAAGCGGGDDDKDGGEPAPEAKTFKPVPRGLAFTIKPRTSEEDLRRKLRVEPILVQRPTSDFAGGCLYYRMATRPISDNFQYCLNEEGVQVVLTALGSSSQPNPPKGASQARSALIARGDTICQGQNGKLGPITKDVARALAADARRPSDANAKAVTDGIRRFVFNLEKTHELLAAFEAPPDTLDVYEGYVATIEEQAGVLEQAGRAYADGDIAEYERLGQEFSAVAPEAKRMAKDYGFSVCSASTFG